MCVLRVDKSCSHQSVLLPTKLNLAIHPYIHPSICLCVSTEIHSARNARVPYRQQIRRMSRRLRAEQLTGRRRRQQTARNTCIYLMADTSFRRITSHPAAYARQGITSPENPQISYAHEGQINS